MRRHAGRIAVRSKLAGPMGPAIVRLCCGDQLHAHLYLLQLSRSPKLLLGDETNKEWDGFRDSTSGEVEIAAATTHNSFCVAA